MQIYKKWLNIAIIFILSLSLLSPAAMAEEQSSDLNGQKNAQTTVKENSQSTETTTNDSAQIEVKTDKQALQAAIAEAKKNKDSTKVSVDGTDIDPTENWVTQAELDAYAEAITAAQELVADEAAIQGTVTEKTLALEQSTETFNKAKKVGIKNTAQPAGYVTIAVEKFTLGQGYAIEPIQVPFYEGNMVGEIVATLLGSGNYNNGRDEENISYLANIRDSISDVNIPQYILDKSGPIGENIDEEWLGERDYTGMSGWMYTVNHKMPNVGMSNYDAINGDVIRLQFTVHGFGSDLGFGWGSSYIEVADKDELTTKVAEINSAPNKAEILAKANVQKAYDVAYRQLTNMESSQANVNLALEQLTAALDGKEEVVEADKTALQAAVTAAELNKATVKVSVNGTDIDSAENWVTQADFDAYTTAIKSAQDVIADEVADQDAVNAEASALIQSTEAFNEVKKVGTKPIPTEQAYSTVGQYILKQLASPNYFSEWKILALARGGYEVPAGYYDTYYQNVVDYVVSKNGELSEYAYTDYSRLIIALTAIGKDPTNVGGYNLVEKLADFDKVTWQGVNGAFFALIALGTWDFELSNTATTAEKPVKLTTKENLIDFILEKQLPDKGWTLFGTQADTDMTAMAIQSLAPYYNSHPEVKVAVDEAIKKLAAMQQENGGYIGWKTESVESAAQVVTALASLGIDANADPRFNKVIANIMTYYSPADGGFKRVLSQSKADSMATEQVGYTLAAHHRLLNGQTALYDMSDTKSGEIKLDTTKLQAAVTKAETNKASVKVSVDGTDIDPAENWVTQADLDDYTNAIKSAQDLIADTAAIQDAVDAKTLALNQSTEAFNKAKKAGTKSTITTPTEQAYNTVGQYMLEKAPNPKFGSEWFIISLARGGATVPSDYYDTYYKNVVEHVKSVKGELHRVKYTEYSRLIIALTAIGKDPTNVGGYNLVEKLADFEKVTYQGVNGAYFALIALGTWDFDLSNPEMTAKQSVKLTTKENLIDFILEKQLTDNGWALSGTKADPDMTAMAIQSLAPYYNSHPKVKVAVDNALTTLATMQKENGGYATWGTENVESAAQVVTALASLGIDANADPRFNKVIANIMTYYSPVDGGFKHVLTQTKADGMATEQVGYTLAAHHRVLNGQSALYDMSDTKSNPPINPGEGENPSNPSEGEDGNTPTEPGEGDGENGNNPGNGDGNSNPGGNIPYGTATFSIKISSSEVPLSPTAAEFYAGETVVDVLKRVTSENGISLSYRETQYGTYIDGIDGLYEFDRGPLSGWMYRVNGVFPSYSAGLYTLQPGDRVEWLYTLDLGKDIGGYVDGIENGEAPGEEVKPECKEGSTDCKEENKCAEKDEQCSEETNKDEQTNEENNTNKDEEVTVEESSNKAVITAENIQQYVNQNISKLVIKVGEHQIEVPTASLKGITLAADEKVVASIITEPNSNEFTVNFGIEAVEGEVKPVALGKDYLKVTLPVNEAKPNTVVLQLVEGEYKPVPHTIINGEIVLFTKTGGTFITTEKQVTFKDIEKLANKDEIEFLASRLIIQGVTEESFEPNKAITRAQFAAIISRSLGLQTTGTNPFADTEGKWYAEDVQALFEAGITKGTTPSTFNPEAPITRQQAAAFTARILEYLNVASKETGEVNFNDAQNISAEYLPYIELLNSLDIMTGKQDGSFAPGANLTRAQTAKIIKRALNFAGMM